MKKNILLTLLLLFMLLPASNLIGQGTPPPPPPNHGDDDDYPTPTGSGLFILALSGIAYGYKIMRSARKNISE